MTGQVPQARIEAALQGDRRALSRLLSQVEAGGAAADAIVAALYPRSGKAHVIGLTGAPGTGKSTLAGQLAAEWRRRGQTIAIVTVDPSSPLSGGALLGDRVRMGHLSGDPGVFVRSMASRGASGGLAEQTAATAAVLAAAGFDTVLIETVGAGQDELAVTQEAQTIVVVSAPGLGDSIQALKAGILEVADILVVNKADRDGADRLVAELTFAAAESKRSPAGDGSDGGAWHVPVLRTVATSGAGVPGLVDAIARHREWLGSGERAARRARCLAERQIIRAATAQLLRQARQLARANGSLDRLVEAVAARQISPAVAAARLLDQVRHGAP